MASRTSSARWRRSIADFDVALIIGVGGALLFALGWFTSSLLPSSRRRRRSSSDDGGYVGPLDGSPRRDNDANDSSDTGGDSGGGDGGGGGSD